MLCNCTYAFFVDGVPVHCNGNHLGEDPQRHRVMHQLPRMDLTPATLIETYGRISKCVNCARIRVAESVK